MLFLIYSLFLSTTNWLPLTTIVYGVLSESGIKFVICLNSKCKNASFSKVDQTQKDAIWDIIHTISYDLFTSMNTTEKIASTSDNPEPKRESATSTRTSWTGKSSRVFPHTSHGVLISIFLISL
jgi:hypothetical protein